MLDTTDNQDEDLDTAEVQTDETQDTSDTVDTTENTTEEQTDGDSEVDFQKQYKTIQRTYTKSQQENKKLTKRIGDLETHSNQLNVVKTTLQNNPKLHKQFMDAVQNKTETPSELEGDPAVAYIDEQLAPVKSFMAQINEKLDGLSTESTANREAKQKNDFDTNAKAEFKSFVGRDISEDELEDARVEAKESGVTNAKYLIRGMYPDANQTAVERARKKKIGRSNFTGRTTGKSKVPAWKVDVKADFMEDWDKLVGEGRD